MVAPEPGRCLPMVVQQTVDMACRSSRVRILRFVRGHPMVRVGMLLAVNGASGMGGGDNNGLLRSHAIARWRGNAGLATSSSCTAEPTNRTLSTKFRPAFWRCRICRAAERAAFGKEHRKRWQRLDQ